MIKWLVEQLASFYLGNRIDSFMSNAKEKRKLDQVEAVISSILEAEKGNAYYNSLDRILSSSKLIDEFALNHASHSKDIIRTCIAETLSREKDLSDFDRQRIGEVIIRIFDQARNVLLEPESLAEKREVARLKDESEAIQETVRQEANEIKGFLQNKELTDSQYSSFEEKVIQLYLQGQIKAISDTIVEMDSWVQFSMPAKLNALVAFLKIVIGYHEHGTISSREVDIYLSQNGTVVLDKLFVTFLLCFGDKASVDLLLDQYQCARWINYHSLFELVNNPREMTFDEVLQLDVHIDVLAAAILKNNLHNVQVYERCSFFNHAYQVLPAPWISRFLLFSEHLWYAHTHTHSAYNCSMFKSCHERAERFYLLRSFFSLTAQKIKKQFYCEYALLLSHCDLEYIRNRLEEVRNAVNDEVLLVPLYIEYWKMQQHIPEYERIETLLNSSLAQNNHEAQIQLFDFLLINKKNDIVYTYLDERRFLLKQSIYYLQVAVEAGFSHEILLQYADTYKGNLRYYCLCDKYLHESEKKEANYSELALEAFFNEPLCLIDHMSTLLQYAYDQNRLEEFEAKLATNVPLVVWRIRAKFYMQVVQDNAYALECIRRVVDSPIATGADYFLLGRLTASSQEAYNAFETGYQQYNDLNCLYNLLCIDYQHCTINEELLQAAGRIDDCTMQCLVAQCYKQIDHVERVRQHLIKAALLCTEYHESIMGQLTMFFLETDKEDICDAINDHSHVILMDGSGETVNICFYPDPQMLPMNPSEFANARHYLADYKNQWYVQLRGRKTGQELFVGNIKYLIRSVGSSYIFLTHYCMEQLLKHKAMYQISGSPEELWDKMFEITVDSAKASERLLEQYTKSDNDFIGYRSFVRKTGTSYLATMNTLVECGFPLRSVISNTLLYPSKYIVGLDTLFLLSKLPLIPSELDSLCQRLIMSESNYGYYQSGQSDDFNRQAHSAGYLQLINGRMQMSEQDINDPCAKARELYNSLAPIVERVPRKKAMFEFPFAEKRLVEKLSENYGPQLFDNIQLVSDQQYIVLNDRAEAYIYHALGKPAPMCTIMNLLALDDVSFLSKISCFEKLVELRYHGVLSYSFFHVLNKQLKEQKRADNFDVYEAHLTRIITIINSIFDKQDPFLGDMRELLKHFYENGTLSDDLPSLCFHLFVQHLPKGLIDQMLLGETASADE